MSIELSDEEAKKYAMGTPVGVAIISNTMTVEIMYISYGIEDEIIYRYFVGDGFVYEKATIEYAMPSSEDEESRPYFKVGELPIYLNEVMKI